MRGLFAHFARGLWAAPCAVLANPARPEFCFCSQPISQRHAMHDQSKGRPVLMVRGRILVLFAICTFLIIAAAGFGFWRYAASLHVFEDDVMSRQSNAIEVEAAEINFKKQVQEWKDTLLRGKNAV